METGLIYEEHLNKFAGGITISFVPWPFEAASFYSKTEYSETGKDFTWALVYAILRGPLITLEFATLSGITEASAITCAVRRGDGYHQHA
jgi:hypothetical protein